MIRVGTSGWSYPSGEGTWNGLFYPAKRAGFDELAFYADHFTTVEVNASFYRVPSPATVASWARRTPKDFDFSLKLYQKFTHPEMFLKAIGQDPADLDRADVDAFRAAIDPLVAAGKLGALLAQFPASFRNEPSSRAYLEWLLPFRGIAGGGARPASARPGRADAAAEMRGARATTSRSFATRSARTGGPTSRRVHALHGHNAAECGPTRSRRTATTIMGRRSDQIVGTSARPRAGEEDYVYANNHFSRSRCQCRDR